MESQKNDLQNYFIVIENLKSALIIELSTSGLFHVSMNLSERPKIELASVDLISDNGFLNALKGQIEPVVIEILEGAEVEVPISDFKVNQPFESVSTV